MTSDSISVGAGTAVRTRLNLNDVKVIGVATIGWTIDIFDLMIVLHLASQLSAAFFPESSPLLALTATYVSFAISVVFRPLGSLLFGAIADTAGRRKSMILAVMGAGISTALVGVLPTAAMIGLIAPLGLVLLRVAQGLFVGGITASTHTIATESVPERFRGLTAGIIKAGASLAVALINLIIIGLVALLGREHFDDWGWRLVFAAGLLGSLANLALLLKTEESPLWRNRRAQLMASSQTGQDQAVHPTRVLFSRRWRSSVIAAAIIVFAASAPYYLTVGILPTVYKQVYHLPQEKASWFLTVSMIGGMIVAPLCGHISQHVGRRVVFLVSGIAVVILVPGLYGVMLLLDPPGTAVLLASGVIMVILAGAISAPLIIFLNEQFPTEIRSTATAFTWNIGYGLSGLMPALVVAVSPTTDAVVPTLLALSLIVGVVFLISVGRSKESRGTLADAHEPMATSGEPR